MPRATNVPFTHVSDTASSLTGGSLTLSASASAASARGSNTATKTARPRRSIRCWCTRNLPRQGSPQRPQALLPSWSPFGDFVGPHFYYVIFLKSGVNSLYFSVKRKIYAGNPPRVQWKDKLWLEKSSENNRPWWLSKNNRTHCDR